jgi:hypothetical protein
VGMSLVEKVHLFDEGIFVFPLADRKFGLVDHV